MRVSVKVKPNSKKGTIVKTLPDGKLEVHVNAPATEGRANLASIEVLAKHFNVSKSKIKLVQGAKSKYKVFDIN